MVVEYFSNNSGGGDWLDDDDWNALEQAGWKLFGFDSFIYEGGHHVIDTDGLPKRKSERPERPKYAYKHFDDIQTALLEFEKLTGESVTDEGCNCCGAPHEFRWGDRDDGSYNDASGDGLAEYLYGEVGNMSKRELLEKLKAEE